MPRQIVYRPPSRQAIQRFVEQVSSRLGARDPVYLEVEVTSGFRRFLQLAVTIVAKRLNMGQEGESFADDSK